jgi:hypothetical protein
MIGVGRSLKDNRFIYAPISVEGIQLLAAVDTMATHSLIDQALVDQFSLTVTPAQGSIQLGTKSSTVARIGFVDNVTVSIGDKHIRHRFEVHELGTDAPCILGLDILPSVGIGLTGIPVDFPREKEVEDAPVVLLNLLQVMSC